MAGKNSELVYPPTEKKPVIDTLFGQVIIDNYRWLEDYNDQEVQHWLAVQEQFANQFLEKLPQRNWLRVRLGELRRYDYIGTPQSVLKGNRIFFWAKKKNWERSACYYKENEDGAEILLLNPNDWGTKTLNFFRPSRDGKYLAFGTAEAGNEETIIKIMEVDSKKILADTLKGWRQHGISWLPDNSGFYYSALPRPGEVPPGEENYWRSVFLHKLNTPASDDQKVFFDTKVKEYFHSVQVSEDGQYIFFYKGKFNANEIYGARIEQPDEIFPIITGFDAQYDIESIDDKLIIWTDLNAPNGQVFITDMNHLASQYWKVLIPQSNDNLQYIRCIAGHIFAVYSHNAHTIIKVYSIDGKFLQEVPLPAIGSAWINGKYSKPDIWVNFTSFTYPNTIFKYSLTTNKLKLYFRPAIKLDLNDYIVEQVWYQSKDQTMISMFLIHHKDIIKNGKNPVYLTGYGGFNIAITPYFSTSYALWLEAGGIIALPNLRGGGEYGKEWHEAGMLTNKQHTFDDFIAAAQWLINNNYTDRDKLAIGGGSNGGLLIGAVITQRPDLFKVAYCAVPLLDMLRYHKFGYANIWAEEYGSADNPEQFKYLLKYSPYHNVKKGIKYPAVLFVASENDARCAPLHAMKMTALMQDADQGGGPILFLIQKASGHGGGTTISEQIAQNANIWAFLMSEVGLSPSSKE